jgi:serine/threonine protein kinase
MKREIEVHSRLKHPNIVEFFGYFQDDERCEGDFLRHDCCASGGSGRA